MRAIDSDDLVHWIELHPAVGQWLAVRIGKRPRGIRQLPELWSEWSCATQRPLTTDLMLIGRDEEGARIHRWLRDRPSIFSLQGETADEAIAFLSAVINELPPAYRDPYLARALVPEDADTARILADGLSPLIIVLNSPEPGLAQHIAAKGHHVFAAFGADTDPSEDTVRLTRPRRHEIEECLMGMGFDHHEARNLANDTARSLTVLRRLIPAAPRHQPHWAKAQPSKALLVALLAGGWIDENKQDRAIIEALAEQKYDQFVGEITPLVVTLDGPIRKSGGAWKLASPRDAWLLLSRYLTNADVERFIQAFSMVLSEIDPRFNMPEGEEPLGLLRDVAPSYSGLLRRGLSETIILMSLFGDRAVCVSHPDKKAERAVADLLAKADEQLWWSLSSDFQRLAEGAPEAFLDGLSDALVRSPTPLSALFRQGNDTIFGREYLSDLLWALERLAWSVPLFGRVSSVLAGLAEIDPGGRFVNRPANTLRHLFLLWSPQTNATLDERLRVLDILRRRRPNSSWALMIAITPKAHDTSTPNARPQWRDFSIDRTEDVTYDLIRRGAAQIVTRLLHDVGVDVGRWEQMISLVGGLEPTLRDMASARLREATPMITQDGERAKLRATLRGFLNHHRSFPDAEWAIPESELENFQCVYDQLEPSDLLERHAYLFNTGKVLVRPSGHQWEVNEKLAGQLRVEAVEALISEGGAADILRLARAVKNAEWVGRAAMESSTSDAIKAELLKTGLRSDDQREADLAHGMIIARRVLRSPTWTDDLWERTTSEGWGPRAVERLLFALPIDRTTWNRAAAAGADVETAYWKQVSVFLTRGSSEEIIYAAEKLIGVSRARHAVDLLGQNVQTGLPSTLVIRALRSALLEKIGADGSNGNDVTMFSYYIAKLLQALDVAADVGEREIVELEWAYFQVLQHSERPARTLQKALASNPAFFMEILCAVYVPSKDSGIVEPEPEDREKAQAVALQAWRLLRDWRRVPGSDDNGEIDGGALETWVKEVRKHCAACGRVEVGDRQIGNILAAAATDKDGIWPPAPIRDVIEITRSRELETGILVGVYNRRGVTMRSPLDGGAQERDLATNYRRCSKAVALEWSRTSALLEKIARSFEDVGRHEDEAAEQREWL